MNLIQKLKDYQQLMKLNLSLLVVFSSVVSYLIVPEGQPTITKTLLLFLGGLLVTGAANASNEIWEKEIDQLMRRTMTRPLPEGRMGKMEASIFTALTLFSGLYILYSVFNPLSSLLALISYLLYVLVFLLLAAVYEVVTDGLGSLSSQLIRLSPNSVSINRTKSGRRDDPPISTTL